MRWAPVLILLLAVAIAVLVARNLPADIGAGRDEAGTPASPVDAATRAVTP